MKFFEFNTTSFPKYAIIWATSESESITVYKSYVKYDGYSIPTPIDLDKLYDIVVVNRSIKRFSDLDEFSLVYKFSNIIIASAMNKSPHVIIYEQ